MGPNLFPLGAGGFLVSYFGHRREWCGRVNLQRVLPRQSQAKDLAENAIQTRAREMNERGIGLKLGRTRGWPT